MTKLQMLLLLASIAFMYSIFRTYQRKKIGFLTFIILFCGGACIAVFSLKIEWLNAIGITFGLNRGADLIVYMSIIILFYIIIHIFNIISKNGYDLTKFISSSTVSQAFSENSEKIKNYHNTSELDEFIFNIRVYNEAPVLGEIIDELVNYGVRKMIFINDGSKDESLKILEAKREQYPNCLIIILSHAINRGGGAANKTGYLFIQQYSKELKIKRAVGFDPDGQMDIQDIKIFQKAIQEYPDTEVFLGSRFIKGGSGIDMPTSRKCILFISRLVTRIFYGIKVTDPHNGYRVYTIPALKKIQLTADGMHYANEINEQIASNKIQYREVPVNIRYTEYSLNKGQKNSNSIKLGFEMIYQKFFSK